MEKKPLLHLKELPSFKNFDAVGITPAVDTLLKNNRIKLEKILQQKKYTWGNLMRPLEKMEDDLHRLWSMIEHLNMVANSKKIRQAHHENLPKLTEYETELGHNTRLYRAISSLKKSKIFKTFDVAQQKIIQNYLRDFKLSGIHLKTKEKKRFAKLEQKGAALSATFSDHVLDATQAWFFHATRKKQLSGLPKHTIHSAKTSAREKKLKGWVFTLNAPVYQAVMMYADDRAFRREMYTAYSTRASDKGPNAKKFDNSSLILELLKTRRQMARLVGFKNYAQYSLATKMAKNSKAVLAFLNDLVERVKPAAKKEFSALKKFARENFGVKHLKVWDIAYYSEKLRKQTYHISEEALRAYFPEDRVLKGLFQLVEKLFAIKIVEKKNQNVWHQDVRFFEIYDARKKLHGKFYADLYARENKRGGAWMADCCNRRKISIRKIQNPVAYLNCNFKRPEGKRPSLLTHDEVVTLFHEFGHALHHLLTKVDYADVSGTNGVEWDAVELPSQFLENFAWEKMVLKFISKHHKTGKPLSDRLIKRLIQSKNFHIGLQILRQLEFGLLDFHLHTDYSTKAFQSLEKMVTKIRRAVSVIPVPKFNRFLHSFSHIFGGGYAAGYYSYLWAEVLSSDAYAKFEEDGIFNARTGQDFLHYILEPGGTELAAKLFKKFRGRSPTIDALLRHVGLQR